MITNHAIIFYHESILEVTVSFIMYITQKHNQTDKNKVFKFFANVSFT